MFGGGTEEEDCADAEVCWFWRGIAGEGEAGLEVFGVDVGGGGHCCVCYSILFTQDWK